MLKRHVLGVVPARLGSSRLAQKPLFPVLGRPLLEWVWRRVEVMSVLDDVVVATDSDEVAELCREIGAAVVLTSPDHPSGTDRVAEVAALDRYRHFPVVANIQGDEPLLREDHLVRAVDLVAVEGWSIGTCATPIHDEASFHDPGVVKVVRAADGRALYFSRAAIPHRRETTPESPPRLPHSLAHIGIYTYTREALRSWVALPPSPLEETEKLEQLRPLEAGLPIGVAVVSGAERGIDTLEDVARVEELLRASTETRPVESGQS
jgi:3-deoxy-manno-octulosonate cytidylyltransferase (CMP-KDO synthetase)